MSAMDILLSLAALAACIASCSRRAASCRATFSATTCLLSTASSGAAAAASTAAAATAAEATRVSSCSAVWNACQPQLPQHVLERREFVLVLCGWSAHHRSCCRGCRYLSHAPQLSRRTCTRHGGSSQDHLHVLQHGIAQLMGCSTCVLFAFHPHPAAAQVSCKHVKEQQHFACLVCAAWENWTSG